MWKGQETVSSAKLLGGTEARVVTFPPHRISPLSIQGLREERPWWWSDVGREPLQSSSPTPDLWWLSQDVSGWFLLFDTVDFLIWGFSFLFFSFRAHFPTLPIPCVVGPMVDFKVYLLWSGYVTEAWWRIRLPSWSPKGRELKMRSAVTWLNICRIQD